VKQVMASLDTYRSIGSLVNRYLIGKHLICSPRKIGVKVRTETLRTKNFALKVGE